MQLLLPDIVAELVAKPGGFSPALSGVGLILGLLLWIAGWWGHRFWIVLFTTVAFGIFGLQAGPAFGTQPLVAGVLFAVAAGVLALALVRLIAFGGAGLLTWFFIDSLFPQLQEPLICFLVGGLVGIFLFRFWTMAMTSFVGTLLMGYSGLCLAHSFHMLTEVVAWMEDCTTVLNWSCGIVTVLGLGLQFYLERRRRARNDDEDEEEDDLETHSVQKERSRSKRIKRRSWWPLSWGRHRKAG